MVPTCESPKSLLQGLQQSCWGVPSCLGSCHLGSPTPKTLAFPKTGTVIPGLGPAFELSFCLQMQAVICPVLFIKHFPGQTSYRCWGLRSKRT